MNRYRANASHCRTPVVSILLYGCTTWTLTKRMEKKLDSNYTRMLKAILNKSWRQHHTKRQLYGHLPPTMKTFQVRRTRHAEHCWRSRDELISDAHLWTPSHGRAKAGWPGWTYIQQLCADTGCNREDLPEAMDDREGWRESGRVIRADGMTWWRWWSINIAVTVSFGKQYAWSVCPIFHLCRKSNVLEKSMNKSVASRVFARAPMIQLIVRI